jgi:hypothetical protein
LDASMRCRGWEEVSRGAAQWEVQYTAHFVAGEGGHPGVLVSEKRPKSSRLVLSAIEKEDVLVSAARSASAPAWRNQSLTVTAKAA